MIKEIKKKEVKLHNYQKDAFDFSIKNIDNFHVLLAAAPNAGKTIITSFIIKHLVSKNKRILCSVHGTNVLKRQFYNSVCNIVGIENVSIYDTSDLSLYDPNKPVQIMIYQNTRQMAECVDLHGKFDYLIIDEAHKFYDGTISMDIITTKYVSGNHLLLTGSPSIFKEKVVSGEIRAKYISASLIESTHSGQYDDNIRLDVVSNDVHLTIDDYNRDGEVVKESHSKLTNNDVILESLLVDDFGKTIIFVKRTKQADEIQSYLNKRGIVNFISHSKTDKDSSNISIFRKEYTGIDDVVLIVVGRATEGYDDPNVSIIDLTYTKDINTLSQRYCRVIRKRTDAKDKRYVKVVPNNDNSAEVFIHIMTAVLMLLKQEHYENFNGKNFSIPTIKQIVKPAKSKGGATRTFLPKKKHETNNINDNNIVIKSSDKPVSVEDLVKSNTFNVSVKVDGNIYEITENDYNDWVDKLKDRDYLVSIEKTNDKVDDDLLMETKLYSGSFFDTKNELYGLITRYATSNLHDVLREINGELFASEEEHIQFILENDIKTSNPYHKEYKKSPLNLHSCPWNLYDNGSISDYFERIWGDLKYGTEQEHLDFIKENDIRTSIKYTQSYKFSSKKLTATPWIKFGEGNSIKYFESIWGTKYATGQEHLDFIKENDIRTNTSYTKLYKSHHLNLHSNPWSMFGNGGVTEYFESIWGEKEKFATEQEHLDFIKENNIRSSSSYSKLYKGKLKLHSAPWSEYAFGNGNEKDYFESIWGEKEKFSTEQEHIDYIKENNIRGGKIYSKLYKKCKLKLHSSPWSEYTFGNGNQKDYFESIWGGYASEQEHIDLIRDNFITTRKEYIEFLKKNNSKLYTKPWSIFSNKESAEYLMSIVGFTNYENEHLKFIIDNQIKNSSEYNVKYKKHKFKLVSNPWEYFNNQKSITYFENIWGSSENEFTTMEEHFNICVVNNLTGNTVYRNFRKKNNQLKLRVSPEKSGKIDGKFLTNGEYFKKVREAIKENESKNREYKPTYLGEFSEMNKKWNTSNSNTTHQKLLKDKSEWVKYHELYSKARQNWSEIPYIEISKIIKDRPDWIVGDFGCGENLLSKEIKNKVHSFDHVSIDDDVISCDLTNVPLDNNSLDVAVFSLSLMGTNYIEYLKEAHRVLKPMAQIFISEPSKRWEDKENELKDKLINIGFTIIGDIKYSDNFIYINGIKN
jgi:superfamily II DNA or RNA helicase